VLLAVRVSRLPWERSVHTLFIRAGGSAGGAEVSLSVRVSRLPRERSVHPLWLFGLAVVPAGQRCPCLCG